MKLATMGKVVVCIICLSTDVRMFNMDECGLSNIYSETIGGTMLLNNVMPRHVCFICKHKLFKMNEFKTTCLRAYYNIYDLYMSTGKQLTHKSINKLKNNLAIRNYSIKQTESISINMNNNQGNKVKDELTSDDAVVNDDDDWLEFVPVVECSKIVRKKKQLNTARRKANTVEEDVCKNDSPSPEQVEDSQPAQVIISTSRTHGRVNKKKNNTRGPSLKMEGKRNKKLIKRDNLICPECGVLCSTLSSLAAHRRWQHPGLSENNYQYKCSFCDLTFRYKIKRVYHERIHTDERPFICEVCAKRFTASHSLVFHMRTHTGERPFPCDKCGKSFAVKGGLRRHMMIHTGHKPFKCPHCDRCFNQSNSVKTHVHTVHMKLPSPYVSKKRRRQRVAPLQSQDI